MGGYKSVADVVFKVYLAHVFKEKMTHLECMCVCLWNAIKKTAARLILL